MWFRMRSGRERRTERSAVDETPELVIASLDVAMSAWTRKNFGHGSAEDEGDDLEEEGGDVDGLRTEIEDLSQHCSEAGQADGEETHPKRKNTKTGVVLERHQTQRIVLCTVDRPLLSVRAQVDKTRAVKDITDDVDVNVAVSHLVHHFLTTKVAAAFLISERVLAAGHLLIFIRIRVGARGGRTML